MGDFGIFDFIIFSIFGFSCIIGFIRGFIDETFSVINIFLSGLTVYLSYPHLNAYLESADWSKLGIFLAAVIGVFLVAWIFFSSLNAVLKSVFKTFRGTVIDRSIGLVFGFIRAAALIVFGYLSIHHIYGSTVEDHPPFMTEAKTYNFVKLNSESVLTMFPSLYGDDSAESVSNFVENSKAFIANILGDGGEEKIKELEGLEKVEEPVKIKKI